MSSSDREDMISRVIDRASIPGRHRDPQLATALTDVTRVDVPTPHGTVAAWRVGTGPAVLLVHGWQDSARLWEPLMAELADRNHAFVALDLPGHGFSEGERCMSAEVPDAVAAVAAALGPIDAAVAHSFATGGTALAVAEGTSVDRLVLIAPPLAYTQPAESDRDATDAGSVRWRRIATELGFDPAVGDEALAAYRVSLGPLRGYWNLSDGLAELDADVLLVASVDDERFDLAAARAVAAHLPRDTFLELAGLDHRASARDATAVQAIAEFLE